MNDARQRSVGGKLRWNNDSGCLGYLQLLSVFRVGQKRYLIGPGRSQCTDLFYDNRAIAFQHAAKAGDDFVKAKPLHINPVYFASLLSESALITFSVISSFGLTQTTS